MFDQSNIGGTSQAVSLINGTTYYWRVDATNGGGTSAWSTTWSFTTALPSVQFTSASQSKSESGGTMTITAQLSGASGLPVTVPFTLSGTATQGAGNDYTITASPITIAAGNTTATITITIINDPLPENNETVIVTMGTPTNATLGATTVHTATIIDDDSPLTLSSPSNGAGCQAISLTLSWTAITGVSNYQAQVATVSDFSTTFLNQTGITAASQAVNSLANNTTYYWRVRATLNQDTSLWSATWSFTTVPAAPTGTSPQTFCAISNPTVASLTTTTGTNIKWYSVATGGTVLAPSTALATGTYYASQTVSGCESTTRLAVAVTVNNPAAPTGSASQSFCSASSPTVANLAATPTGTGTILWYAAASGGTALSTSTALVNGTSYYASQTVNGCESTTRLAVTATVNTTPAAPTGSACPVLLLCQQPDRG